MLDNIGFIETIKVINNQPLFLVSHIQRLITAFKKANIDISNELIFNEVQKLIVQSIAEQQFKNLRVRIQVDIINQQLFWKVSSEWLENSNYYLNEKGLEIGIYTNEKKILDNFKYCKTTIRKIYANAKNNAIENNVEENLILNENENITDASIYNIFWIKDKKIYTNAIADGCVDGIFRKHLIVALQQLNIFGEKKKCTKEILLEADELFFTNVIRGIRWIGKFENKIYKNEFLKSNFDFILEKINENLK